MKALLPLYLGYAVIIAGWFVVGILAGWVMGFSWIPKVPTGKSLSVFDKAVTMLILVVPHSLIIGLAASILGLFVSERASVLLACIPFLVATLAIVGFVISLFF